MPAALVTTLVSHIIFLPIPFTNERTKSFERVGGNSGVDSKTTNSADSYFLLPPVLKVN
jgi:hypothetical protein